MFVPIVYSIGSRSASRSGKLGQFSHWHKVAMAAVDLGCRMAEQTATKGEAMTYNPTRDAATAEHFSRWAEDAKTLGVYSLLHVIKDCREAAEAMKGWNPVREGYYIDQMLTYAAELNLRNAQLPFGLRHRI